MRFHENWIFGPKIGLCPSVYRVNGGSDTEIGYVCRFIIFYWFCHPKMAKINSNQLRRCRKKPWSSLFWFLLFLPLHKTSPWSFHSVTIDEEQKIFYNYISRFKNISDNVMTHKAKVVVAFLRRISAKKHLTDFPHMTLIFRTFNQSERSELQIFVVYLWDLRNQISTSWKHFYDF